MDNNIYKLEDYYKLIDLQKKYEEGLIDEDDMTLNEINSLINLYLGQTKDLRDDIKKKLLQRSKEWYK